MNQVCVSNSSLASNFVVSPEDVTPIFIHFLPSVNGSFACYQLIRYIPVQYGMHPTKDSLIAQPV
jgi:hypothetical protein